uniref:GT23 domain-containing protein n=3 Tax=Hemiselmis andersenii TaxID=464988 RepID=A0A7S1HK44_HEMAN|mmetsp:Transcript_62499/g.150344  ORF Transcript_62499/g.150344 Transcript_62499/m.150344 type:complete len:106 (+) Transcript_62499:99-416(+)
MLMATMDRRMVAETTLVDILLLSQCDYFVGTLSSHFGALAYELSWANKGYHIPHISLDHPWSGSLLAPVQYYGADGETTKEEEHNTVRKDFTERQSTGVRKPVVF